MRRAPLPSLAIVLALAAGCREEGDPKYATDADKDGVRSDEDCDDQDAAVGRPSTWYVDGDGDGYGGLDGDTSCAPPANAVSDDSDCDDADPAVRPAAAETCDGTDEDCDGAVDDGLAVATWYADADADGYGDDATAETTCAPPDGAVATGGDCDDADPAFHPDADETDCTDPNDYNCDDSVGYADLDGDGYAACAECDDANAAISPAGVEVCNATDDDCDGAIDEDATDPQTFYMDLDGDGYGDPGSPIAACEAPSGAVTDATDCDDGAAAIHPDAAEECDGVDQDCDGVIDDDAVDAPTWYTDADGDGYGDDLGPTFQDCSAGSGVAIAGDCDDQDPAYNPGAAEADCADPNDYNCDGSVGYADNDGDGYPACEECDDNDAAISPLGTEVCDGVDNDCDGAADENDAVDAATWYADADLDGYGDAATTTLACETPAGFLADATDCDDTNSSVNPGRTELCNGIDDDCDGTQDEEDAADAGTWYADTDGDSYGDAAAATRACEAPAGTVADATDCDDAAAAVNPGAAELCDGLDDDCDGAIDEDGGVTAWYTDADGDAYGEPGTGVLACAAPAGTVADDTDCDDLDARVNPGATEVCDGLDNDCGDGVDEGYDVDGDGTADCADVEVCDGLDNNGDGAVDEGYDADADGLADCLDTEVCDGLDNDGDGAVDEAGASGESTWYADLDGDGFGDASAATLACDAPADTVFDPSDCDDGDGSISPAASESCNGVDDDCVGGIDEGFDADLDGTADCFDIEACDGVDNDGDGLIDEAGALGESTGYADTDGDGYGDPAAPIQACTLPAGTVANAADCDDGDAAISPAGVEVCNDADDDCDGSLDEDPVDGTWYYTDADCDGEGDAGAGQLLCETPPDSVTSSTDCDDSDPRSSSLGLEICDGADNDCDGTVDDSCTNVIDLPSPSGDPVDLPAETGACASFAEVGGTPDPHSVANLPSYMRALEGTAYTRYSATDVDANALDWSTRCGANYATPSPGNFGPTSTWPVMASLGSYGAARFRGYLHIGCGEALDYTLGLIGNDALSLTIEGTTVVSVNWGDGRWKKFRYVSFPAPGIYAFEVQWSTNFACDIDPFELVWAEGHVAGYDNYDTMCAYSACAYGNGVAIPGFAVIDGDHLLEATDGSNTSCEACTTNADCSSGTCNSAGLCE